jgi:CBS domain containing-hemolysin-like protein
MSELLVPFTIIIILVLLNGFFVGAEFAIAAAPVARIAKLAEEGSVAARHVLAILRDAHAMNRYISTAQVGITVASLGLGMYGEHAIAEWLLQVLERLGWLGVAMAHSLATVMAVALLTYLHVVIGEMVPKSLVLAAPERAALGLYSWMDVVAKLFRPLTLLLGWLGNLVLRLMRIPPVSASDRLISASELEYIVEASTEEGLLAPNEQIYLENVLDFGERTIGQVMTPRTRMQALTQEATNAEVLAALYEHGYSRYPIYAGDRDHIIGVLHIKDLARHISQQDLAFDLTQLMRPAVFVPETLGLEQMLKRFRKEHMQIAIVVDEFGGTAGLITLEDLVEELIGEIQDEFDEELPPIERLGPQRLRVRGDLLLDELNQHYEFELDHPEADTVGGLVMALLGHVPQKGESVQQRGLTIEVDSTEGLAVRTAIIQLPMPATTAPTPSTSDTPNHLARDTKAWSILG